MLPADFLRAALVPALGFLPPRMESPEARALVVAIALQESRLIARRQYGGPARSYLQFELGGIEGVLTHRATSTFAMALCLALDIGPTAPAVYQAIEFNDAMACGFARLLLWTLPRRLPVKGEVDEGWDQYLAAWRPGRPRPETWTTNYVDAWHVVEP